MNNNKNRIGNGAGLAIIAVAIFALIFAFIIYNNQEGKVATDDGSINSTSEQTQTSGGTTATTNVADGTTATSDIPQTTTSIADLPSETSSKGPDEVEIGVLPGFKAPDFELESLVGKTVKLSDYKGQIVVLNFWASWRSLSNMGMPDLQKQHEKFSKLDDIVLLAINVGESKNKVQEYKDKFSYTMNFLIDTDQEVAKNYYISSLPTTFVLDREGIIVEVHSDVITPSQMNEYIFTAKKK